MEDEKWVRRRREPRTGRARQFAKKYRFELVWAGLVLVGLFLLFEPFSLRETLWVWARTTAHRLLIHLSRLDEVIGNFLARTSPSDLVGFALIVAAVVALAVHTRQRLLTDQRYTAIKCPKCNGAIHRVHRSALDRWVSAYVPVRRYRCADSRCGWQGLRTGKSGHTGGSLGRSHSTSGGAA